MRLSFICLLVLVVLPASCRTLEPDQVERLTPGHAISIRVRPEHAGSLRLDLTGLEAASILLETSAPNIDYRVISDEGDAILSGSISTSGWAAIPFAAAGFRQAHLQLSTQIPIEDLPGVRVRAELRSISLASLVAQDRAAHLLAKAQSMRRSLSGEEVGLAISKLRQAAALWRDCGDLEAEALALGGAAESEMALSRYAEARRSLAQGMRLVAGDDYLRGWLMHLDANIHLDLWEGQGATRSAQDELRLAERDGDSGLIALAHADLAGALFWTDFPHARPIAQQAHAEAEAAGVPEALGLEGKWMGWIEEADEHYLRALRVLDESELYFRRAGDARAEVGAAVELAAAVTIHGDRYSALIKFEALEPMTRRMGNRVLHGLLLGNIGDALVHLGKPRLATSYYRKADTAYMGTDFRFGRLSNHLSQCEANLSWSDDAMEECRIAAALAREIGNPSYIGESLLDLGLVERKAGRGAAAFRYLTDAVESSRMASDLRQEASERLQLGELFVGTHKQKEALEELLQAEQLSGPVTDPASLLEAQYAVARWYMQDSQYEKASAELKPALEKVEATRRSVASSSLQASYFAAERKCYELGVELQMREFRHDPAGSGDARALELSEQSHARGLLDVLGARTSEAKIVRSDLERERMNSKITLSKAFDHRLKLLVEGGSRRDFEASSAELAQALVEMERADETSHPGISDDAPRAAPMSANEIEEATRNSGTAYFEYELGPERSYLWVIRNGELKSYELAARDQLERLIKEWRSLAAGTGRFEPGANARLPFVSARLSCALLANAVKSDMTRLLIVPDGNLAMVPFTALPENGCSHALGEPLVAAHEVIQAPSLSIFLSRKTQKDEAHYRGALAIVADAVFDAADSRLAVRKRPGSQISSRDRATSESVVPLARLVNTGYEAAAIEDTVRRSTGKDQVFVALGMDANVDTVLNPAMRDYRIWHLATHGIYDESMPEFSGLVLSQIARDRSPRSGFLKAYDIASLDVRADLVVLNACDSGAGEAVSGEGVMGLSYAFLHAGARQVISTLWSVDDAKSKDLMVAFYKDLMRNGGDAAAALRHAQLALMRQHNASDPYYWAGFELTSVGR